MKTRFGFILSVLVGLIRSSHLANGVEASIASRQSEFAAMPLPSYLNSVPRLNLPLYVMEYHVWWGSPFGAGGMTDYVHWCTTETTDSKTEGADYIRENRSVGYPLAGLYNSENRDIIRWQLRCLHNIGVDGVFVQLFPARDTGEEFTRETIWKSVLEIAAEEGVKVAIHDEVQFKPQGPSQNPEVMAKRAGAFLRRYKDSPAYLRIHGMPAYTFQLWNNWNGKVTPEGIETMMRRANEIVGEPVWWIPYHGPDARLYGLPDAKGFVVDSSMRALRHAVAKAGGELVAGDWSNLEKNLAGFPALKQKFPSKALGLWGYPGFDDQSRTFSRPGAGRNFSWVPRMGGRTFMGILNVFARTRPDFVMLSSWNDWEENTALEPGLRYDGYAGDPYLYCRIVAATKGHSFVPPPLPPKEAIDPLLWQTLFGFDRTPPKIDARFDKGARQILVTATDSAHGIKEIEAKYLGDAYLAVTLENQIKAQGIIASKDPQDAQGGWQLRPNQSVAFEIDGRSLANSRDVYLALEIWDERKGRIDVTYPSVLQPAQRKKDEANNLQEFLTPEATSKVLGARVSLQGSGQYLVEVRKLRAPQFLPGPMLIEFKFNAEGSAERGVNGRLVRIHLFKDGSIASVVNKESAGALAAEQRRSSTITVPTATETPLTAAFIFAEDTEGNRTPPLPVVITD